MAVEPFRIADSAHASISEYLELLPDDILVITASEELKQEFRRLSQNPGLGTAPTGPFELRPIHGFFVTAGDRRRFVQVSYRISGPGTIDILTFSQSPA